METKHPRTPPTASLLAELRKAIASNDVEALAELYAEDAVLEEVSNLHPPAHPNVARGRDAIRGRFEVDLTHDPIGGWSRSLRSSALLDAIETEEAIAFTEERVYAAGDRVIAQHVARKRGGRIAHDRVLVAWDQAA
jgi:ketosteroid isomerase-like protein